MEIKRRAVGVPAAWPNEWDDEWRRRAPSGRRRGAAMLGALRILFGPGSEVLIILWRFVNDWPYLNGPPEQNASTLLGEVIVSKVTISGREPAPK